MKYMILAALLCVSCAAPVVDENPCPCDTVLFHDLTATPVEMRWMVNCGDGWEPLDGPVQEWLDQWIEENIKDGKNG